LRKEKGKLKKETASAIVLTLLIGSMLFSATSFVKAQTDIHDLEAGLSSTPAISGMYNHMNVSSTAVLNATVTNRGNVSELNVVLELLINGSVRLNAVTPTLGVNSTFWIAYFWNTTDYVPPATDYNLTVYAPPVAGETNIANNNGTRWVRVCQLQNPIASFNKTWSPVTPAPGPVQNISNVTFDASSSSDPNLSGPTNLTYSWLLGEGPQVFGPVVSYTYTSQGNLTVTLKVHEIPLGLESFASQSIWVYAPPLVKFEVNTTPPWKPGLQYYVNEPLTFNATESYDVDNSTQVNHGIMNFTWDFGDGNRQSSPGPITTHTYTNESINTVLLNITDIEGLANWTTLNVTVSPGQPIASFAPPPKPWFVGYNLTFNASTSYDPKNWTAPNHGIANYTWVFGDGSSNSTTTNSTTHIYQNAGNYNVNLTVTDQTGLSDSTVKTVAVTQETFLEVVDATNGNTTIVHDPGDTFYVNLTVINVTDLYSYDVNLTWPGLNTYPIFMSASAVSGDFFTGATSSDIKNFPDEGYVLINITRMGSSNGVNGTGTLAVITFKVNGTMTGNCNITISYSLLQNSTVLQNSTGGIITSTLVNGIFYTGRPVANFTYTQEAVANKTEVIFDASASYDPDNMTAPNSGIASYYWDFGDNHNTTQNSPTFHYLYENPGFYNVNLTVTDYMNLTWSINYTVLVSSIDLDVIGIEIDYLQFNNTSGLYETAGALPMNVTVKNDGNAQETFNVTVYFNDTLVDINGTVTLAANTSTLVFFYCRIPDGTLMLPIGVYNITAKAGPLPFETPEPDNTMTNGAVRVYVPGDINRDGKTNILDSLLLANSFEKSIGQPGYNPAADLNCDGTVNILDDIILSDNFLRQQP
jgi:PKD repeat protein